MVSLTLLQWRSLMKSAGKNLYANISRCAYYVQPEKLKRKKRTGEFSLRRNREENAR